MKESIDTPIYTELKNTFTPNSSIRKRIESLGKTEYRSSGGDPIQLRIFTDDIGEAIHMGVVAGTVNPGPNIYIDLHKEQPPKVKRHPLLPVKVEDRLMKLYDKFVEWIEEHRSIEPRPVYRSACTVGKV